MNPRFIEADGHLFNVNAIAHIDLNAKQVDLAGGKTLTNLPGQTWDTLVQEVYSIARSPTSVR